MKFESTIMNLNINQVFKYILPFMYSLTACYVMSGSLLPKEGTYDKVNKLCTCNILL